MNNKQYKEVLKGKPDRVTLCIVSKNRSSEEIIEYYNLGERIFAEGKDTELLTKVEQCPKDIHWHFIGHLQSNKVRKILPYVDCIQSVDRLSLLETINDEAKRIHKFKIYV